jgi:hypothetical protein
LDWQENYEWFIGSRDPNSRIFEGLLMDLAGGVNVTGPNHPGIEGRPVGTLLSAGAFTPLGACLAINLN